MCTGLFYLAQENFIQAEMAFKEAAKQLSKAMVCSSPEQRTEDVCHDHSKDNVPVDKPGNFFVVVGSVNGICPRLCLLILASSTLFIIILHLLYL